MRSLYSSAQTWLACWVWTKTYLVFAGYDCKTHAVFAQWCRRRRRFRLRLLRHIGARSRWRHESTTSSEKHFIEIFEELIKTRCAYTSQTEWPNRIGLNSQH